MRKITALAIASLLSLTASSSFAAQQTQTPGSAGCGAEKCAGNAPKNMKGRGPGGEGMEMGRHMSQDNMLHGDMFKQLKLTDEQKKQMAVLMTQARESMGQQSMGMEQMNAAFGLITTDKFDEAAFRKQAEAMASQRVERQVAMAKIHNQMYNLLTPEQKATVAKHQQERMAKMAQWQKERARRNAETAPAVKAK